MLYFEKSQPAPDCLAAEKAKINGDYKCGDVLERIKTDFHNKCYICEHKAPTSINVEHFRPHKSDLDLKFDWDNLFLSCGHCNNTKLANFETILNCTDSNDAIESRLKYVLNPFPFEQVRIIELDDAPETVITRDLLLAVYNGTTKLKTLESANLRDKILKEIMEFQRYLCDYFRDTNSEEDRIFYLKEIRSHLHKGSNFTAFKRWIILENERLKEEFEKYFN